MTRQYFRPGDRVRVAAKTIYPPLAKAMRKRQTDDGFEIVASVMHNWKKTTSDDPYIDNYEFVVICYADGSYSGALNAEIFEKPLDQFRFLR
jgi:hypothetical protein